MHKFLPLFLLVSLISCSKKEGSKSTPNLEESKAPVTSSSSESTHTGTTTTDATHTDDDYSSQSLERYFENDFLFDYKPNMARLKKWNHVEGKCSIDFEEINVVLKVEQDGRYYVLNKNRISDSKDCSLEQIEQIKKDELISEFSLLYSPQVEFSPALNDEKYVLMKYDDHLTLSQKEALVAPVITGMDRNGPVIENKKIELDILRNFSLKRNLFHAEKEVVINTKIEGVMQSSVKQTILKINDFEPKLFNLTGLVFTKKNENEEDIKIEDLELGFNEKGCDLNLLFDVETCKKSLNIKPDPTPVQTPAPTSGHIKMKEGDKINLLKGSNVQVSCGV